MNTQNKYLDNFSTEFISNTFDFDSSHSQSPHTTPVNRICESTQHKHNERRLST